MTTKLITQEKATLLLINTLGFPIARRINVQRAIVEDGRLTLQYTEKGKRKPVAFRYAADTPLALFNGWHNVNGAMNQNHSGAWTQFDADAMSEMMQSINQIPVYSQAIAQ